MFGRQDGRGRNRPFISDRAPIKPRANPVRIPIPAYCLFRVREARGTVPSCNVRSMVLIHTLSSCASLNLSVLGRPPVWMNEQWAWRNVEAFGFPVLHECCYWSNPAQPESFLKTLRLPVPR